MLTRSSGGSDGPNGADLKGLQHGGSAATFILCAVNETRLAVIRTPDVEVVSPRSSRNGSRTRGAAEKLLLTAVASCAVAGSSGGG